MKSTLSLIFSVLLIMGLCPTVSASTENSTLLCACVNYDNNQKWGYINESGEFIIKPRYDFVNSFTAKGIAVVANNLKDSMTSGIYSVCFIDKAGKVVIGPYDSDIPEFENGYAVIHEKSKGSKLIDEEGKIVLQSKYRIEGVSEGIIKISEQSSLDSRYGYMNMKGNIIIPPEFVQAESFQDGTAWIQKDTDTCQLLDVHGNVLLSTDYFAIYQTRGDKGILPYKDKVKDKYGYKTFDGTIMIGPMYAEAQNFFDGLAVVSVATGEYETKQALINLSGEYVLKPEYSSITSIGQGLFAVTKSGFSSWFASYYPSAIFDNKGKQLSDYCYYGIEPFSGDYTSACSDTQTFFIDKTAKIVDSMPKANGVGKLKIIGNIIKADIDGTLSYLRKDGSLIWEQSNDIPLSGEIKVMKKKFRPDFHTFVEYPEIQGLTDLKVQDNINSRLKEAFLNGKDKSAAVKEEDEYIEDDKSDFTAAMNKDLLIIELRGYSYPIGAAHGMPYQEYFHIDLRTGDFYSLKDLFKGSSKYTSQLTSIVRKQIEINLKFNEEDQSYYFLDQKPDVTDKIGFIVTGDTLQLYFNPYEIAPFAAGFVTFDIPYGQISGIINDKGAFWNSFNKKILKSKVSLLNFSDENTSLAIQNQIKAYETKIIEAINTNDFKKVEQTLLANSSLYNSQMKLVKDLYRKGIKEKLAGYEIYAIVYSYSSKEYRVYVTEDITIKYPSTKSYTTKKYNWCYTVIFDAKANTYKLTKIKKW